MKLVHAKAVVLLTFVDAAEENPWVVTISRDDPEVPDQTRYSVTDDFDEEVLDEVQQQVHQIRNEIDLVPLLKTIKRYMDLSPYVE